MSGTTKFTPQESDGGEDIAKVAAREFQEFLNSGRWVPLLSELFERELSEDPSEHTYDRIREPFEALVGEDAWIVLGWVCGSQHFLERIDGLELGEQEKDYLIRLATLYGPKLTEANVKSRRGGGRRQDWARYSREVLKDVEDGETLVFVNLRLFNGEEVSLRSTVDSFFGLADRVSRTLLLVDDFREASPHVLERLKETIRELLEKIEAADSQVGSGPEPGA